MKLKSLIHDTIDWAKLLEGELNKPYIAHLEAFLLKEEMSGKIIFPPKNLYFNALNLCPASNVRVVILGQDPYHGDNQAHGLAFSVPKGTAIPPSLKNIYKELQSDLDIDPPAHGNLESWAKQGVLLLNTVLSVEKAKAASHQAQGWEQLTDAIIALINKQSSPVIFMLWGAHAQKKAAQIDSTKHLILSAPHPSPLSAHRGFLGCKHFSKANKFLSKKGFKPINWAID